MLDNSLMNQKDGRKDWDVRGEVEGELILVVWDEFRGVRRDGFTEPPASHMHWNM
jgi:hypothetical protein